MSHSHVTSVGLTRAMTLLLADMDYTAVGTGTTVPAVGDVALATETDRIATTVTNQSGRVGQVRTFHANADLPTIMEETGWFMNAVDTPDNGSLLVHTLLNLVKGSDDLTLVLIVKLNPILVTD